MSVQKVEEENLDYTPRKLYLVKDLILSKPFINEKREALLFVDEVAAKHFRATTKNIKLVNVSNFGMKDIQSACYAAGATHLVIYEEGAEPLKEALAELPLNREYYNSDLTAYIGLQFKNPDENYKNKIAHCSFIVAVNIDKNREQYILYASVHSKSGQHALLAFSDLREFNAWQKKHGDKYKALEVDFLGLRRIGGLHGFLLNPMGSKFFLSPEFIEEAYRTLFENRKEEN